MFLKAGDIYRRLEDVRDKLVQVAMIQWMTSGQQQGIGALSSGFKKNC